MLSEPELIRQLRELGFAETEIEPMAGDVARIAGDIANARARQHEYSPEARKSKLKYIEDMRDHLAALEKHLLEADKSQLLVFNSIAANHLGRFLSTESFEFVCGPIGIPDGFRSLETREASTKDGLYHVLEREMTESREAAARSQGLSTLFLVVGRLARRLDNYIRLMKKDKGGNPGKIYRRYAIHAFAELFERVTRVPAAAASKGRFVQLCFAVFPTLDIDCDDLLKAIKNAMAERRKRLT